MIVDYQDQSARTDITADICIIGAGPAGITLALELASSGKNIIVLEGGGAEPETTSQSLYAGESTGQKYFPLNATRLRALGGSTGHWSGWCGPLNEMDFQRRDWIPHSGWPITLDDVNPYYEAAQRYCSLSSKGFRAQDWADEYDEFPAFNENNLLARFWQFSSPPLNFGKAYFNDLEKLENVTVYTHANATNLNLNEQGDTLSTASISSFSGKAGVVTARIFILACGGIENPRLLLASNNVNPSGVGNDMDLVGRFFMDHVEVESAKISQFDADQMVKLKRLTTQNSHEIGIAFCASETKQKSMRIGNGAAFIAAPSLSTSNGWTSFISMRDQLLARNFSSDIIKNIGRIIVDFDTAAAVLALRLKGKTTATRIVSKGSIDLISICEQVPNRDSRVMLSEQKDPFGNPQASLHWQLDALDKNTIKHTMQLIAVEMSRLDLGRVKILDWLGDPASNNWPKGVRGGHHHMGTTRMSESPDTGVVDKDCKVHQIDNLYIAGSSIFSTGGYVNPTLSIVAFSVRLAEHLKQRLQ